VTDSTDPQFTAFPGVGVTAAERYLSRLCRKSFLSLWSYPGVFRDQGRTRGRGDGKELCDLLVVFEHHIFIFSDKDCRFKDTGDLKQDWNRWFKKAILKSADQVFGAERWIKQYPHTLFLDRQCTMPFPIDLPKPEAAIFHRIVVAHNGSKRCREALGGSGSFMVGNIVVGSAHLEEPFRVGLIDQNRGYVHVFDDTTLDIVMTTLDTISDFTSYLVKKERFLTGSKRISAAGEEELLAVYLTKMNQEREHDFPFTGKYNFVSLAEGSWEEFIRSPERRSQLERDRVSYLWDGLIERFAFHAMTGTQYFSGGRPLQDQERMFRLMAREPRTRRRMLAKGLLGVIERSRTSGTLWDARVIVPSRSGDPYYVLLCFRHLSEVSDKDYRLMRAHLLADYCHVARVKWPDALDIVGIATESGEVDRRSEDMAYLDTSGWTALEEAEARETQQRLRILQETSLTKGVEHEYPVDATGTPRAGLQSRNALCKCLSGKRFRRCCGKKFFPKGRERRPV
jgi:hypothetical protein